MKLERLALYFRTVSLFGLSAAGIVFSISVAHAKFGIGVSSTNYLGEGSEQRKDRFSTLDLELNAKSEGAQVDSRAMIQSQIGLNDSDYRFIELPEVYLATSKQWTGPYQATLGRKLVDWSEIDHTWATGAFQPRFRWDYLRPQAVGLLGTYLGFERGPLKATLFYSPIYIPDRGAPLDFSDGRMRSTSPWMVNPPYQIEVLRKQVPIQYNAQIPAVGEIIRQHSVAAQASFGEDIGARFSSSYAYKPMNQLLMSYTADLNLSAAGDAQAILFPRVAYHHVAAFDASYNAPRMGATLSFLADLPVDHSAVDGETVQQVGNFFILSPTLRWNPFRQSEKKRGLSLSYLHVLGNDLSDRGGIFDGGTSEFDSRYPYKSAFLFTMHLPTWRRFSADLKLILDLRNPGTLVSWQFDYAPEKDWKLFLSTDVLSSFSKDETEGTDFIRRYRENDRVMGGVAYVF